MIDTGVKIEETTPGLFRLEETDGERQLCQFILLLDNGAIIVDAGLPRSPKSMVIPLLHELNPDTEELLLLLTHLDADHCGGTAMLRAAYPQLKVGAHSDECPPLGNPELTINERYEPFAESDGITLTAPARQRIRARLGEGFCVDQILENEQVIDLGPTHCTVLHLPGHSAGHIGVWLPNTRTVVAGDAIMGNGIPKRDGSLLYPPQFISPRTYLATINRLLALDVDLLLLAHEPPLRGPEVGEFLRDSHTAVDLLGDLVKTALMLDAKTLEEICDVVHRSYGGLPEGQHQDLAITVSGFLAEFVANGLVAADEVNKPRKFRWV